MSMVKKSVFRIILFETTHMKLNDRLINVQLVKIILSQLNYWKHSSSGRYCCRRRFRYSPAQMPHRNLHYTGGGVSCFRLRCIRRAGPLRHSWPQCANGQATSVLMCTARMCSRILPFRLHLLAQRTQVHNRRPSSIMLHDMAESTCDRGSKTTITG